MSNESLNLSFDTRKINKGEIISFIKRARLNNTIFVNGYNVSKNLRLSNEIKLNNFSNFEKGDKIDFLYFDEIFSIAAGNNETFKLPTSAIVSENPDYFYNVKKAIRIHSEKTDEYFAVKCIGFNKSGMIFEVFGDYQDFFFNNIDKVIDIDFFENDLFIIPSIKEIKDDRLIVKSDIKFENKESMEKYSYFMEQIREIESSKIFFETLNQFEEESIVL